MLIHSMKIDGQSFEPFVDWQNAEIIASFDDSSVQANLTIENVVFVNEAAQFVRDWVAGGLTGATTGIFESPSFEMTLTDGANGLITFSGCLDLATSYAEISPVKVRVQVARIGDKRTLENRAEGLSFFYLFDSGAITTADFVDVPYVVEKKFNAVEFVILSVTTYLMLKEAAEGVMRVAKDVQNVITIASGGNPVTGLPTSLILAAVNLVINAIYTALLILYIINLIKELISFLISPIREFKAMKVKRMLEKASTKLGYTYNSSIAELESASGSQFLVYLPSKARQAAEIGQLLPPSIQDDGLPNSADFGHTFSELLQSVNNLFRAKLKIDGVNIYQEALVNDNFWKLDANYTIPDVLNESKSYNTNDLISRRVLRYEVDYEDTWTIDDPTGKIYEIGTFPITTNNEACVGIKGFEETRFNSALGSRKDGLNTLESSIQVLASLADSVINAFGGNSNLAATIEARVGLLRISQETTNVSKLLYMEQTGNGLRIPANARDIIGGEALYNNYHVEDSFVRMNNRNQKRNISDEELEIPFGFNDLITVVSNSYCNTQNGQSAKIESLTFKPAKDRAKITGWIREKYTSNLKEIYYNSDDPNQ